MSGVFWSVQEKYAPSRKAKMQTAGFDAAVKTALRAEPVWHLLHVEHNDPFARRLQDVRLEALRTSRAAAAAFAEHCVVPVRTPGHHR